ncbi:MAG: tRNA epoxyqueuosine(34) reductase QueG [Bacteriovoracia bacterium]
MHERLKALAHAEGFPIAGAIDVNDEIVQGALAEHWRKYSAWIDQGSAGSMHYLVRGRDFREDPRRLFPATRGMLCVGLPYPNAVFSENPQAPRYARYLRGDDYHRGMKAKLERLAERVAAEVHANTGETPTWKVCVDTSAVLERAWAAMAGLGWIGKNSMLIHPKHGSYFFIGEILLSVPVGRGPEPLPDYCGHCTRCLDGCPTAAFREPRYLESRRCISYATLEERGEWRELPLDTSKLGRWVAGCDICQEVCPFNRKSTLPAQADPRLPEDWAALAAETDAQYAERVKGSALSRVKPAQFKRNLAMASVNFAGADPVDGDGDSLGV